VPTGASTVKLPELSVTGRAAATDTGCVTALPSTFNALAAVTVVRRPRVVSSSSVNTCARFEFTRAAAASFSVSAVPATSSKDVADRENLRGAVREPGVIGDDFSESCTANVPAFVTFAGDRLRDSCEPSTLSAFAAETAARWPRVVASSITPICARLESIRAAAASFSVSAVPATSSKMYPAGCTFVVPSVKPALSATFSESCVANVPTIWVLTPARSLDLRLRGLLLLVHGVTAPLVGRVERGLTGVDAVLHAMQRPRVDDDHHRHREDEQRERGERHRPAPSVGSVAAVTVGVPESLAPILTPGIRSASISSPRRR
jgi:hypothetical protein